MAIRMRASKNENAKCCECGKGKEKSLEVFDVMIGNEVITICDECMNKLLSKSLKASCMVNAKLKSNHDLAIISTRNRRRRELK
jgi:hypothetical protein